MHGFTGAVAVIAAALFHAFTGAAFADLSPRGIVAAVAGFDDSLIVHDPGYVLRHRPSSLIAGRGTYVETFVVRRETFRSFSGAEKNLLGGTGGIGLRHDILPGRAGLYIAWLERSGAASWPFSDGRVMAREYFRDGTAHVAGYGNIGGVRMGMSAGVSATGGADRIERALDLAAPLPFGAALRVEYSLLPYEWGIRGTFKGIEQVLYADFTAERGEIALTAPAGPYAAASLVLGHESLFTRPKDRALPGGHAQIWTGERMRWEAVVRETCIPGVEASFGFGGAETDGGLGLTFNGEQYLRAVADISADRFFVSAGPESAPGWIPTVRFDRTVSEGALPFGYVDSWPFTPQQIAIFGDKTWTFQGHGNVICDGLTMHWRGLSIASPSLGWRRLHYDYRLKIIERDHFPFVDLWSWLIGRRRRTETDNLRYYDIAVLGCEGDFVHGRMAVTYGVEQFVPVRTITSPRPGKPAPAPPPVREILKIKRYGGMSFRFGVRYHL